MSDSELQNFSQQQNFNVLTAAWRGLKGGFKGIGKSKNGFVNGVKSGYKRERAMDKAFEDMWSGPYIKSARKTGSNSRPLKDLGTGKNLTNKNTTFKSDSVKPKPIETKSVSVPKDDRIGMVPKIEKPTPVSHPLPEATNPANAIKETEKTLAKPAENTVAKEVEATLPKGRFNSPAEAIASSKKIQNLDEQITKAVSSGNRELAKKLRKVRDAEARNITVAYHKAYSGKLRNIHEWGRDHKLVSAPIGVAGALGAGALASAGAAGAAGVIGLNKAADVIFD